MEGWRGLKVAGENPGGTKEHTGVTSMSAHVKYMPVRVRGVEGPGGGQANRLILRVGSGTKRGELQPARVRRTVP